uniref:L-ascorbate metabolism protein UlaG, beta-lactamase superfamily n=1 Tax=Candidatus Kentrum sp. DK TaxID=2126562 RepID=A0A450T610_9GAMM|nr:MAG: L-ascorbate metabolism protein UlaG, beta-lactamase superfamily [Candidatus Kentron sp. DK]
MPDHRLTTTMHIPIRMLGQSGCRLSFPGATIYVDPYLSNSVQELDAHDLGRQLPVPFPPEKVHDADWVLITHGHKDHCDPHTLPKLAAASPTARFIGPGPVVCKLKEWGIASERIITAQEGWFDLAPDLRICAIPAAHPEIERDGAGNLACVGYLLDYAGKRIYLAGDTFARQEIIDRLIAEGPVHTAFLPVNEHNFFRDRRGILGNMSVHEAFQFAVEIGARQVVAVHWDMFAINAVDPEEIRLIHQRMRPGFALLLRPALINLADARISLIIRTLNEATYLEELLQGIATQQTHGLAHEVVLVDSGSTDDTLKIAERHGCRIHHITREEFSFGRSLNRGCEAAEGGILVMISGHCVPIDDQWLQRLCQPILDGAVDYAYGRQFCGQNSYFSECRIFAKYFPENSRIPQDDFFCNNANAAILRSTWENYRFDEDITGLEDMALAQRLVANGGKLAYVAEAGVLHHHNESWPQIKHRFEREAIALQKIMPQVHMRWWDLVRYIITSTGKDWRHAWRQGVWRKNVADIVRYRRNQYWGSFRGNREHSKLSHVEKEKYFFPD